MATMTVSRLAIPARKTSAFVVVCDCGIFLPAILLLIENEWLIKLVGKLKDRERKLLFARVFGELTYEELGMRFGGTPKQVEMSYYYILRKLRREVEVREDEF